MNLLQRILILGFFLAVVMYLFMFINNTETFQQLNNK
jgi:hypothetical protein